MAEHTGLGARSASTPTQENGVVGRVREQATSQLNTQKNKATDGLGSVAQAVRGTTQRLREENHDTVARYAEQAADQLERFSERLKNKDVGELMNDAQRLARRKPAMFVGGAFALGLLGARFMKSSATDDDDFARAGERARGYGNTSQSMPTAYETGVRSSAGTTAAPARTRPSTRTTRDRDYPGTEGL